MTHLRLQLNTFLSGPQAWFFLAQDRGYLRDAGIELEFIEGDTAANAVPRMMAGGFELAYGDMNAFIQHLARTDVQAAAMQPTAIFASYNASPYTIAVPAASAITQPLQLQGKRLLTHPKDAALGLWQEFCAATGIDARSVQIEESSAPHPALVADLLQGKFDGLFGFVNTLASAAIDAGLDPAALRQFAYKDHVPDLYGLALFARADLLAEPQLLRDLLSALNRGLNDCFAEPEAAIDSLMRRSPRAHRAANLQRLLGTMQLEMAHPEGARLGLGDMDDARLARSITLLVQGIPNARTPDSQQIFQRTFLPPLPQRVRPGAS